MEVKGYLAQISIQAGWTAVLLLHAGSVLHLAGRTYNDGLPVEPGPGYVMAAQPIQLVSDHSN